MPSWVEQIRDPSMVEAVKRGTRSRFLRDTPSLTEGEVDGIIKACLDGRGVHRQELRDLEVIHRNAKFYNGLARRKFKAFYDAARTGGVIGRASRPTSAVAVNLITKFMSSTRASQFPNLDRMAVATDILKHIRNPNTLKQGRSSLCGPTVMLHALARDNPYAYASLAIDLYERGRARLGSLILTPSYDLRKYALPSGAGIDPAHWMMAASIRDSENYLLDYDNVNKEAAGITLPGHLEDWFKAIGYSKMESDDVSLISNFTIIDRLNRLKKFGWKICLLLDADLLSSEDQDSFINFPNHWVVLTSPITPVGNNVKTTVYSWGNGQYNIPAGSNPRPLSRMEFVAKLFYYIAVKY